METIKATLHYDESFMKYIKPIGMFSSELICENLQNVYSSIHSKNQLKEWNLIGAETLITFVT